ncbi:HTH-type transcriptional regulator BetI [Streptomyces fumanus]
MATGHTDPHRRDRILDAALDLIAEEGVAGVSHRKIASRAGVPLGSMTYHFDGMDEVLRAAFRRFTDHIVAVFDAHLAAPADREEARAAVADLVHRLSEGSRRDLVLTRSCTPSPPAVPPTGNSPTSGWAAAGSTWRSTSTRTPPASSTR